MATPHISSKSRKERPLSLLLDVMNDCYVDWREDADTVSEAYRDWSAAPQGRKADSYLTYVAAVDREESSASSYAAALAELQRRNPGLSGQDPNAA